MKHWHNLIQHFSPPRLVRYFLQGLLVALPLGVTFYVVVAFVSWIDRTFSVNDAIPGIGIVLALSAITLLGYLGSTFVTKRLLDALESFIMNVPLVKIIYTSLKDLISAFVGDEKKFNQPVLVKLQADAEWERLGFITQTDLSDMGLADKVSVYIPHSYNFSGNLFIVPARNVTPVHIDAADAMKFIVSGGVASLKQKARPAAKPTSPVVTPKPVRLIRVQVRRYQVSIRRTWRARRDANTKKPLPYEEDRGA